MSDFDFEVPSGSPAPSTTAAGLVDMSDVIALLGSGTYNVKRRALAAMVNGVRSPPAETTLTTDATSLQPVSGLELDRVPEGHRNKEVKKLYTVTELRTVEPGQHEADWVEADGFWWEVINVYRWKELGNYFKVLVVRVT